ncbi:unnamed protein product [Caenorhabditis nigoni]
MGKTQKRSRKAPTKYSAELRADLLRHFEAGQGFISQEGKKEISEKYGLTHHRINGWANDRRRRRGVYDETRFCKMLFKFIEENPGQPPTPEIQEEFEKVLIKFAKSHGLVGQEQEEEKENVNPADTEEVEN